MLRDNKVDCILYGMCWKAGLYKHTLNVPVNPYLQNVEIPLSLYTLIKHNVEKNVLFSIWRGGSKGGQPRASPFATKNVQVSGLDLLRTLAVQGGEGLQIVARVSCYAIKTRCM